MSWLQAILIGLMSCTAASTIACLGTTVGNYTLNRPLVASLFVGLILGDVSGCIQIGIPMQVMWIALVTPGGTVASDLRAVSYIGIPLAYVGAKAAGMDFGGTDARGLNLDCLGKVDVVLPLISHFVLSFLPVTLLCYYGSGAVAELFQSLNVNVWYVKAILSVGSVLPAVGIGILLKSVVSKTSDLVYFMFGFALAASMGLTLIAATVVGGVFALINYQMTMMKATGAVGGASVDYDDEEDI